MTDPRPLKGVVAVLIAILVVVSGMAAFYYYQDSQAQATKELYASELRHLDVRYVSNVLVDYGNGTRTWYNDTQVQPGWNLYVTTQLVTNGHMNATYYPAYGSHLVTAIYNVANTKTTYWLVWTRNSTSSAWEEAQVGPDQLQMTNGSAFAWTYCGSDCNFGKK